jgi:hypothetical protein
MLGQTHCARIDGSRRGSRKSEVIGAEIAVAFRSYVAIQVRFLREGWDIELYVEGKVQFPESQDGGLILAFYVNPRFGIENWLIFDVPDR